MSVITIIGLVSLGCLVYAMIAAYFTGRFGRTFPDELDGDTNVMGAAWFITLPLMFIYYGFIKPTFPLIRGIHRKAAGKTWKEEE